MNTELCKKLGLRIKELRTTKGLSQGALADLLNMERSNLTRIEGGRQHPNDENLTKIANFLEVEIKDLYDFGHIQKREDIKSYILKNIDDLNEQKLQFLYKTLINLKELK